MTREIANALDCEVVTTSGGARAVRDRITGEVMHPGVGPLVEPAELYVRASRLAQRLREGRAEPLVLLDVGLGAGSNALAALRVAEGDERFSRRLEVVSFDRSVAALQLVLSETHARDFGFDALLGERARSLLVRGESNTERSAWRLVLGELWQTLTLERAASADVVFWDPFSPRANPELWSVAAFTALRRLCRPEATVHTYSSATATRAALLLSGFAVGYGPEAGGKQATTTIAALHHEELLRPLDRGWLERLRRSSAPLPADAPSEALQCIEALAQFN